MHLNASNQPFSSFVENSRVAPYPFTTYLDSPIVPWGHSRAFWNSSRSSLSGKNIQCHRQPEFTKIGFFCCCCPPQRPWIRPKISSPSRSSRTIPPQIVSLWRIETICAASIFIDVKIELLFLGLAARLSSFQNLLRFLCEYFNSFTLFKNHLKCLT